MRLKHNALSALDIFKINLFRAKFRRYALAAGVIQLNHPVKHIFGRVSDWMLLGRCPIRDGHREEGSRSSASFWELGPSRRSFMTRYWVMMLVVGGMMFSIVLSRSVIID